MSYMNTYDIYIYEYIKESTKHHMTILPQLTNFSTVGSHDFLEMH